MVLIKGLLWKSMSFEFLPSQLHQLIDEQICTILTASHFDRNGKIKAVFEIL